MGESYPVTLRIQDGAVLPRLEDGGAVRQKWRRIFVLATEMPQELLDDAEILAVGILTKTED